MDSNRLLSIASFINKDDKVIDVGCDHGYLGIYLKENDLVSDLLLTDVNSNALGNAIKNINAKKLDIKTYLTDGINNIDLSLYNTITISGMGTFTIKKILSNLGDSNINKIIIQSNNNLYELRSYLNEIGYYLKDEKTILEKGIYYIIGLYEKNNKKNSNEELLYGILKEDKIPYYEYLINNYQDIIKDIPDDNNKKNELDNIINDIKELLKKCR